MLFVQPPNSLHALLEGLPTPLSPPPFSSSHFLFKVVSLTFCRHTPKTIFPLLRLDHGSQSNQHICTLSLKPRPHPLNPRPSNVLLVLYVSVRLFRLHKAKALLLCVCLCFESVCFVAPVPTRQHKIDSGRFIESLLSTRPLGFFYFATKPNVLLRGHGSAHPPHTLTRLLCVSRRSVSRCFSDEMHFNAFTLYQHAWQPVSRFVF